MKRLSEDVGASLVSNLYFAMEILLIMKKERFVMLRCPNLNKTRTDVTLTSLKINLHDVQVSASIGKFL